MLGFLLGLFNAGRSVANDVGNNIENSFRGEIAAKSKELYYWDTNGQQRHTGTGRRCNIRGNTIYDAKTGRVLETIPEKPNAVKCIQQLDRAIGGATLAYPCKKRHYCEKWSINEMKAMLYKYDGYCHLEDSQTGKMVFTYNADYCRDVLTGKECVVRDCGASKRDGMKTIFYVDMKFLLDRYNGHIVRCFENKYGVTDYNLYPDPSSDIYINGYRITFDVDGFNKFQDEYYEKNGFYFTQYWMTSSSHLIEFDPLDPKKTEMILIKAREEDNKHQFEDWMNVEYVGELPEINLNAGTKKKILICDSVSGYVKISLGFKHLGYEYECLECVDNEEAAVQKCSEIMPDIAYIRLHMLECDGIRCIKRLRKIKPDIKIVLIYILTSHKNEEGYWMEKLWEEQVEVQDIIPCEPSESRLKLCLEKQVREECNLPKEHWLAPDFYEK